VEFVEDADHTSLLPESQKTLAIVADLLGLDPKMLLDRVIHRIMKAGGSSDCIIITLNASEV
jgi:hypothetical protein